MNRAQVVACLSETIRNDSLVLSNPLLRLEKQHRISQSCRQQLRNQLVQQHEDVKFNPGVHQPCLQDEKKFCASVKAGQGRILECLKANRKKLEAGCHAAIFQAEKEEMDDSSVDFPLKTLCKEPIRRFCKNDLNQALDCLKAHLDDRTVDVKCRTLVLERMAEQNLDIRFNPSLKKACSVDIPKFCRKIWENAPKDHEMEGLVINCLKENYITKKKLSQSCTEHLKDVLEQQALHFQLDPVLVNVCGKEVHHLCSNEEKNNDGQVEECLKTNFDQLVSKDCKRHIALLISAAQVDIQADPLLHRACAIDLVTYCKDVPSGDGRRLRCLLRFKERMAINLDPKCAEVLKSRTQLFARAAKALPLESFNDLVEQLSTSPSRNYFLTVGLSFVGIVLITGVFCGRVTKRQRVMKNR